MNTSHRLIIHEQMGFINVKYAFRRIEKDKKLARECLKWYNQF